MVREEDIGARNKRLGDLFTRGKELYAREQHIDPYDYNRWSDFVTDELSEDFDIDAYNHYFGILHERKRKRKREIEETKRIEASTGGDN